MPISLEVTSPIAFLALPKPSITLPFRDLHRRPVDSNESLDTPNGENKKSSNENSENGCVKLAGELAAVLFENIHLKLKFYVALEQLNPKTLKQSSEHPQTIVLECGRRTLADHLHASNCLFITCRTPEDLLSTMHTIMENERRDIGNCILNTVVIENLSAFFWDKRRSPRHVANRWYGELAARARDLADKYSCNVIFTMWDRNFDRGYNSKFVSEPSPSRLDDMTYIPADLFESIPYVFALRASDSLRYIGSQWKSLSDISTASTTR